MRPLRHGIEKRQPPTMQHIVNEGGNEDGLSRARQSGNTKTDRWIAQVRNIIARITNAMPETVEYGIVTQSVFLASPTA